MNFVRNFFEMPLFLRLLTGALLVLPVFLFCALIKNEPIIFGKIVIESEQWWKSGAGMLTLVATFSASISSVKMLNRISSGRGYMVVTFALGVCLVILLDVIFIRSILRDIGFYFNLGLLLVIYLYLYFSPQVRKYFSGKTSD